MILNNAVDIKLGTRQVDRVYKGSNLIWQGSILPRGYKKCLYLESNGNQYVELPFGFYNTDEVYLESALFQNANDKFMVAPKVWNDGNNRFSLGGVYTSTTGFCIGYGGEATGKTLYNPIVKYDREKHSFYYKNKESWIDDGTSRKGLASVYYNKPTQNLRLFFGYNKNTSGRIYRYWHKKNNELVIDLIPCLDNNNKPCMYDMVNKITYYNNGTDEFTYELE